MGKNDLLNRLLEIRPTLPNKQFELCNFMIENIDSIGLITVAELASAANVGTTTVMRLIKNLGFSSFTDIKKSLLESPIQSEHSAWWHLQESFKKRNFENHTLVEVAEEGKKLIDETLSNRLIDKFDQAAELILNSEKINILGIRSNRALALYLGYLLEEFMPNVNQLSFDYDFVFDRTIKGDKNTVLILIDNAPFTSIAYEVAKFHHENDNPVILITDHLSSQATTYSSVTINTVASEKQYSVIPTLFVIEALVIELGRRTSETSVQHLQRLSEVLEEQKITLPFMSND